MNEEIDIEEAAPWLVLIITLIGGGLRVLLLDQKGLWLDETFSIWVARHSIPEMLQWIARIDQHPPLYYLLLHYWIALTRDTPYDARLLSVLFGTAAIPVIYLIGKRMAGVVMGLAAAVLMAFSLYHIAYAQEARMYTLLTLNAAVAIYALVRLLTDLRTADPIGGQLRAFVHDWRIGAPPDEALRSQAGESVGGVTRRRPAIRSVETDLAWAAFIVFSAATLLTHNTAVFFVLATNIFVLGLLLFQRLKPSGPAPALQAPAAGNWVKAQLGIFLLWVPFLLVFVRQTGRVEERFWIPAPTWDSIVHTLRALLNPSAPGQASQVMLWILGAVLCLGLIYFRKRLAMFWFLVVLFATPILGEVAVSLRRPIFLDRTLIWITIPLLLLMAAGIAQLRFRFLMIVGLGIFAMWGIFSTGDYLRFVQKEDWSTPAGYVANFAEKGDLILFNSNFVVIPFDYYFGPYEKQYAIQVEKVGVPEDLFGSSILEPRMTERDIPELISLLQGRDRVWLVYSHDSYTDPEGLVPQTLASEMQLLREREFRGGKVQLYGNP